mgnify:CR=1 FL=1
MKLSNIAITLLNHTLRLLTKLRDKIVDYKVDQFIRDLNDTNRYTLTNSKEK